MSDFPSLWMGVQLELIWPCGHVTVSVSQSMEKCESLSKKGFKLRATHHQASRKMRIDLAHRAVALHRDELTA